MFGSQENERKKREKRENCNLNEKLRGLKVIEKLGLQNVIKWLI